LRKETLPEALKVRTNEIEVYQTVSAFKISDQEKFDGILLFCISAVKVI
jgi:uroporphyrinogen-III synthase